MNRINKTRTVTISDKDWARLEAVTEFLGLRSVSMLISYLGNREYRRQRVKKSREDE